MTVDVEESPELVDELTGVLVYLEHEQVMVSTEFPGESAVLLDDPRSGERARLPLPGHRANIGPVREDGTLRIAGWGRGTYSLIDGTIMPDDIEFDRWIEPDARISASHFAPRGENMVIHMVVPERPATSSQPKRDAEDVVLVCLGDRMHLRSGTGDIAWSPDGDRLLFHAHDGLLEYRATGEPAVRRIADHSDEPVAIGYVDGEPCMALSAKWHPGHEHALPDWPLRALELPGLHGLRFDEIAPGRVLYESLPTEGAVQRRTEFSWTGNGWYSVLRVCDPGTGRTAVVDGRYDGFEGPYFVGYSKLSLAELGLTP